MEFTFWIKKESTIFVGGDPSKGNHPILTAVKVVNPQVLIDPDKGTITIVETK